MLTSHPYAPWDRGESLLAVSHHSLGTAASACEDLKGTVKTGHADEHMAEVELL